MERTSHELVSTMIEALGQGDGAYRILRTVSFEIVTPENVRGRPVGRSGRGRRLAGVRR